MGQAKKRGTPEQRQTLALARQYLNAPADVPCKTCGAVLNDFEVLQTGSAGATWQKRCECGAITSALMTAPHSDQARALRSTLALAGEIAGPDKRVSVSFLQAAPKTGSAP